MTDADVRPAVKQSTWWIHLPALILPVCCILMYVLLDPSQALALFGMLVMGIGLVPALFAADRLKDRRRDSSSRATISKWYLTWHAAMLMGTAIVGLASLGDADAYGSLRPFNPAIPFAGSPTTSAVPIAIIAPPTSSSLADLATTTAERSTTTIRSSTTTTTARPTTTTTTTPPRVTTTTPTRTPVPVAPPVQPPPVYQSPQVNLDPDPIPGPGGIIEETVAPPP